MTDVPFSPDDAEVWAEISDFPGYSVSTHGRVRRDKTKRIATPTIKPGGLPIIGLTFNGQQCKRSLPLLVATTFVQRPSDELQREAFDTPIHLNGIRTDNRYSNLAWRPLWFARKYVAQFNDGHPTILEPVEDVERRIVYATSMDAAIANGLLDFEIVNAMEMNTYVWPTGQIFRYA
jgi:hypothetical protein